MIESSRHIIQQQKVIIELMHCTEYILGTIKQCVNYTWTYGLHRSAYISLYSRQPLRVLCSTLKRKLKCSKMQKAMQEKASPGCLKYDDFSAPG